MKIALDFDGTYTLAPAFWHDFALRAVRDGHDVRIVTARDERYDRTTMLAQIEQDVPVIFTRGVAKRWHLEHFGDGFVPDVWVDDRPESILENSPMPPEALVEWRANRGEGPSWPAVTR